MTVYPSKIDKTIAAVLALAMAATAAACVPAGRAGAWWIVALMVVTGLVLPLWLLLGTRYVLADGCLRIRSGPFAWRIPVAEITRVEPTSSPLSGPALSLDRLRVDYGRGRVVMISPRDKARFVRDVQALRRNTG